MKVATEEHRVITVITAAKQTLFRGRSQTYGLSHIVEGGINLTKLDVTTGCMATYPNYLVPERMKGPGQVLGWSQRNNSFLHLHAWPTRLWRCIVLCTEAQLDPACLELCKGWDWHSQDQSNTRRCPRPCSSPSFPFLQMPCSGSAISSSELSCIPGEKGLSADLNKDLSTWRSCTVKSYYNDQPAFQLSWFVCQCCVWWVVNIAE